MKSITLARSGLRVIAPITKSILPDDDEGDAVRRTDLDDLELHPEHLGDLGREIDVEADDLILVVELAERRQRGFTPTLMAPDLTISSSVRASAGAMGQQARPAQSEGAGGTDGNFFNMLEFSRKSRGATAGFDAVTVAPTVDIVYELQPL